MKKKIISLCLVVCLLATAIVGGTLAYFTDTDAQENVFTVGNVKIDLYEDFGDNDGIEKLLPNIEVEKQVYVENTGSEKAYVRVHIAIPSIVDSGSEDQPQFAAYNNTLHWNMSKASMAEGKWNWLDTENKDNGPDKEMPGYPKNGGHWNMYQMEIGGKAATEDQAAVEGILYNVYVATYETALENGEITLDAIKTVYLDEFATNEKIAEINEVLGNEWKIYVVAEAGQVEGFDNAYEALDKQFGVPGTYEIDFEAEAENKLYVEGDREEANNVIAASVKAEGVLSGITPVVSGNTVTYTGSNITVAKSTNPNGVEAYWTGYLTFTAPDYADVDNATFTRDGESFNFKDCKDGEDFVWAWIAADKADKDVHNTYTFDWDGDGIYEAIYSIHVTDIVFAD